MSEIQIRSDIRILVEGWTEKVDGRPTRHAGLLPQLRAQVTDSGGIKDENRSGKATGPKLPCDEDALSLLVEVESTIAGLAGWIGPGRAGQRAETNLWWINGELDRLDPEILALLAEGLTKTRDRIEVFLQWMDGGTHVYLACPRCEHRDLWFYTSEPGRETAVCRHCHEKWIGEAGLRALNSELR